MTISSSAKTFILLNIIFLIAFAGVIYVNYKGQQQQMMEHIQTSATAQTTTIKEALVNMMITNERVDDGYLRKISSTGDIRNISILFRLDSLHLAEDYLDDSSRTHRLAEREVNVWDAHKTFSLQIFETTAPEWYLISGENRLSSIKLNDLAEDKPPMLNKDDQLQALIPFVAEKKCTQCHDVQKGRVLGAAVLTIPLDKTTAMLESNAFNSIYIMVGAFVIGIALFVFVFRKQ
jgi:hypothetical protein